MVVDPLLILFPNLAIEGYRITSAATPRYNCIAWAASRNYQFWWPDPYAFWPSGVPFEVTLTAFESAFATLGYSRCNDESLESNIEKIVIYAKASVPTHAARQLSNGRWTSNLGREADIEHASPDALISNHYGVPVFIMRRPCNFLERIRRFLKHWIP